MNAVNRFKHNVKLASYSVGGDDVYASGSTRRTVERRMIKATEKENYVPVAAGLGAGILAHKISEQIGRAHG